MQKLDRSGSGSGLYCWSPNLGTPAVNSTGGVSLPTAPFLGAALVVSPLVPQITTVSGIAGLGVAIPTATLPSIETIGVPSELSTGLLILGLTLLLYVRKNQQQKYAKVPCYIIYFTTYFTGELKPGQKEDLELPLFDLAAVVCATKNFSNNNKLGERGFGSVFKAWMLYTEGRSIEVLDTSVGDSSDPHEVVRSIHVGLSSVQRNPADRPSMPAAVVMLSGEGSSPQPQKPGFYSERDLNELEVDPSSKAFSANAVIVLLH
ncbi:unnamed protein product [Prunus armeniaca]